LGLAGRAKRTRNVRERDAVGRVMRFGHDASPESGGNAALGHFLVTGVARRRR
jgi:hypothetical protein